MNACITLHLHKGRRQKIFERALQEFAPRLEVQEVGSAWQSNRPPGAVAALSGGSRLDALTVRPSYSKCAHIGSTNIED